MTSLVHRAQSGDLVAFEQLYREHADRVYALALRMVANVDQAEDLTQEAFIRAWKNLGSFRGDSSFGTWMHRVTVNVVIEKRRSAGRREKRETGVENPGDYERPVPPRIPDQAIDLERAIAELPPGARKVFVLHDVEGFKHEEIAGQMGTAVGTVKAQLHRARRLLREALTR